MVESIIKDIEVTNSEASILYVGGFTEELAGASEPYTFTITNIIVNDTKYNNECKVHDTDLGRCSVFHGHKPLPIRHYHRVDRLGVP